MVRPDTVLGILEAASTWLESRGVDAPRRSVELLMGHVLGLDRLHLYLAHDRPLSEAERSKLRALVARRAQHEPVAHLLGTWEFYGYELEVNRDVLVPRPETEGLVELVLGELGDAPARVVDLGTGSGAIAIAIALERPLAQLVAVERSAAALTVAARNVARHGLESRVTLRQGSWWSALSEGDAPFDLMVANPPYCDPAREGEVDDDVRRYEPGDALWSPPGRPAACYEEIAAAAPQHLRAGASLCFETGLGAAEPARDALLALPALCDVRLLDDLEGRPRYLVARVRTRR